jgi:DRG Family Regulatory Proteins, Tma46
LQTGTGTSAEEDLEALRKRKLAEGTPVTVESFLVWRAKFDAARAALRPADAVADGRVTGKQMFLQHLVLDEGGSDDDDGELESEGEEEAGALAADEAFLLQGEDATLFLAGGGEDDDLEGLSDLEGDGEGVK